MMQINDRIRVLRKEKGLTLKQLASASGLSLPFLSEVERGESNPSLESLESIARGLSINIEELLIDTEIKTSGTIPPTLESAISSGKIPPDWAQTLKNIQHRGHQPQTEDDWITLYYSVRKVLE